ncbi:MAG: hypothetical protein D3926_01865 [Desulfobacteraceae bacterium]|nr:MAG: hypothetical protein D3926_01865 [Desulfobacteraceae bacterium]
MNTKSMIGILLALAVIGGIVAFQFLGDSGVLKEVKLEKITFKGYVGGEKMGFLANEKVIKILDKKHRITIDAHKKGSVDMVKGQQYRGSDIDFYWPSNFVCVEWFKNTGGLAKHADVIFNSPIVIYCPDKVADALIDLGIVTVQENIHYIVDFPKLVELTVAGTKWKDINLPLIPGTVKILSTDPSHSNSGNIFYGLLANILHGDVVSPASIDNVLPSIKEYYDRMGFQHKSSGDIFDLFISNPYTYPLLVGYENQLIEYAIQNSDDYTIEFLKKNIRTLYPQPTVWSSHPLITVNDKGQRLIDALKDPEIQQVAWELHGFRSSTKGVRNDPSKHRVAGLPEVITSIIQMPSAQTMDMILSSIKPGLQN